MEGIIDFHSHILPEIDDGSGNLEESLELLRLSASQGIRQIVATPHFYPRYDSPEKFLRRRAEAEKVLRQAAAAALGLPDVIVGAEVYYFSGISDSELVNALTIGGKRCILIEMPPAPWKESHYRELEGIYAKHCIIPIIAHVDRYIRPLRTHGIPKRLEKLPVLVQANADFFIQKSTRSMALRMLKKDQIHLLGSDCHNLRSRRPNLQEAMEIINGKLGQDALARIRYYQQRLLKGQTADIS